MMNGSHHPSSLHRPYEYGQQSPFGHSSSSEPQREEEELNGTEEEEKQSPHSPAPSQQSPTLSQVPPQASTDDELDIGMHCDISAHVDQYVAHALEPGRHMPVLNSCWQLVVSHEPTGPALQFRGLAHALVVTDDITDEAEYDGV